VRISEWKAENGWTGYIEKGEHGFSAVLTEGFGTYDTEEEAEAYLKDNGYEKVS